MTPEQKAEELVEKFADYSINLFDEGLNLTPIIAAKKCALVAVDEIISANPHSNPLNTNVYSTMDYWQEVKQEIEKL